MAGGELGAQVMVMQHDPMNIQPCEWRERFDALVAERMSAPFAWGANDCCLFAADAVLATTGIDHAADFRGTYDDAGSALRVLRDNGGLEAVASRAGDPIPPMTACVGDVGLVEHERRELLAVCAGAVWLAPAAQGLAIMPLEAARSAWKVTHG